MKEDALDRKRTRLSYCSTVVTDLLAACFYSMRELLEGAQGILYINEAVVYRVQGLTRMSVSPPTVTCRPLVMVALLPASS